MNAEFTIGLSSWIIQDGNYGEFARGDHAAFAVEFWSSNGLSAAESGSIATPTLVPRGAGLYEAIGRVVHLGRDWWVIDVGIAVYDAETPPKEFQLGSWLRGEIHLGIDPFHYFESLATQPGAPALIYDWEIAKIEMQTAPFIEIRPNTLVRDPKREGWKEIENTDAWKDDGGLADYLLHCARLDGPVRRTLNRA